MENPSVDEHEYMLGIELYLLTPVIHTRSFHYPPFRNKVSGRRRYWRNTPPTVRASDKTEIYLFIYLISFNVRQPWRQNRD
jgi:hypothetical protein